MGAARKREKGNIVKKIIQGEMKCPLCKSVVSPLYNWAWLGDQYHITRLWFEQVEAAGEGKQGKLKVTNKSSLSGRKEGRKVENGRDCGEFQGVNSGGGEN